MAAELLVTEGPLQGVVLALEKGTEWTLGRDPALCQLVVEDPKMERKACLVTLTDQGYQITNLGETPLFVNERSFQQVLLNDGDTLKIGDTPLVFYTIEDYDEIIFSDGEERDPDEEIAVSEEGVQTQRFLKEGTEYVYPASDRPSPAEKEVGNLQYEEVIDEGHEYEEFVDEGYEHEDEQMREESAHVGEQLSLEGHEASQAGPPTEDFEVEDISEEAQDEEPLFKGEEETLTPLVDLTPSARFLLKVIAGPNTGAEFALEAGHSYLMGTETTSCDIVFHDLSVSREHARLYLSPTGQLEIEDLRSRNGVVIDQKQITGRVVLQPSVVVTLGTTAFFVVDREAPQETLVMVPVVESQEEAPLPIPEVEEKKEPELVTLPKAEVKPKRVMKPGLVIYVSIVSGLALLLAVGMLSLLHTKEQIETPRNYAAEIQMAVKDFPAVKYTYSPNTHRLFLVGHVSTGIEKDELFYNLHALTFLKGIDDHVVNDEAIWQETNILLSKQSAFKGVSMHPPRPALFVLNGYLKTEKQAADLTDWMNIHFNYLALLDNRVVVEEQVMEEISSQLVQRGFGAVAVSFSMGELTLAGYVGSAQSYEFERLLHSFSQLPGVRSIQNFVVIVGPEQQVIDLNQRYPGRFRVTGYSKHGDVSINVVINGRMLMRGDILEGMTLTSIQPQAVFFEKDGLKYKLEYNK